MLSSSLLFLLGDNIQQELAEIQIRVAVRQGGSNPCRALKARLRDMVHLFIFHLPFFTRCSKIIIDIKDFSYKLFIENLGCLFFSYEDDRLRKTLRT
jgi:hypothetical protein